MEEGKKDVCPEASSSTKSNSIKSESRIHRTHIELPVINRETKQQRSQTFSEGESPKTLNFISSRFPLTQGTFSAPSSPSAQHLLSTIKSSDPFFEYFQRRRPFITSPLFSNDLRPETNPGSSGSPIVTHKIWKEGEDTQDTTSDSGVGSSCNTLTFNPSLTNTSSSREDTLPSGSVLHQRHYSSSSVASNSSGTQDISGQNNNRSSPVPLFDVSLSGVHLPRRQVIQYRIPVSSLLINSLESEGKQQLLSTPSSGRIRGGVESLSSRREAFSSSVITPSGTSFNVSFIPSALSLLRHTGIHPFEPNLSSRKLSSDSGNSSYVINMNFNRQTSAPNRPAPSSPRRSERKTSLEVPPRPGSSSPTPSTPSPSRGIPSLPPIQAGVVVRNHFQTHHQQQQFMATSGTFNPLPSVVVRYPHPPGSLDFQRQQVMQQMMQRQHLQQQQQLQQQFHAISPSRSNIFEGNNEAREGYIRSLLDHQERSLTYMIQKIEDLSYQVNMKRAEVTKESRNTYYALTGSNDFNTAKKVSSLIQTREKIRELKIEIFGLVTEIDSFGDINLGHEDIKPLPRRTTSTSSGISSSPPPIPSQTFV